MVTDEEVQRVINDALRAAYRQFAAGRFAELEAVLNQLFKVDPDNAQGAQLMGMAFYKHRQYPEAVSWMQKAVTLDPSNAESRNNLGLCLSGLRDYKAAMRQIKIACYLKPDNPSFWSNLGLQHRMDGGLKESIACTERAVSLRPADPKLWCNLGGTYGEMKDLDECERCFARAVELQPDWGPAHVDLSHVYSLKGDWKRFWEEYEWRMKTYPQARMWLSLYPREKAWDGRASLAGKRLVLFCEQGVGDMFMFVRYLKLLPPCEIYIHSVPEAEPLLSRHGKYLSFDIANGTPPEYDYNASVMSLPYLLGCPPIPQEPYLDAHPAPLGGSGYKVGVCWAGNPKHPQDKYRSFPAAMFRDIAGLDGVKLYSLQKDVRPRKYSDGDEVYDLSDGWEVMEDVRSHMGDWGGTAGVIKAMDLVITADTAVLHLAGAMGKACWGVIPYNPDWRWKIEGGRTEWYPSVRLFRAEARGDWSAPFARMLRELSRSLREREGRAGPGSS